MSKRKRGYDGSIPQNNWNVDTDSDDCDDEGGCVGGILVEGIEEDAIERQRQSWRDQVIQTEEDTLAVLVEYSQSIGSDGAYIYEIAARKQDEKINDGTGVYDVVESMRRANTDAAAVHVRRRDEQIARIELQDGDYVKAYEKYRAYYDRQQEQSEVPVQPPAARKHGKAQQRIEGSLSQVVPVRVSVQVHDAQRRHDDADSDAIHNEHGQYHGQHSQPTLHRIGDDNSTTLLNRLVWRCGVADCPTPAVSIRAPASDRTLVKYVRRHFKNCHAIASIEHKYALALARYTISHPPSMPAWTCDCCRKVFSSAWRRADHK